MGRLLVLTKQKIEEMSKAVSNDNSKQVGKRKDIKPANSASPR